MKKPSRPSRSALDSDHLLRLHQEAIEQLTLFVSALTAAEESDGEVRDIFDHIGADHANTYLTLIHTIGLHDTSLGVHFSAPPDSPSCATLPRILRIRLADDLIVRHR